MACFPDATAAAERAITGLRLVNGSCDGGQGNLEVQLAGVLWGSICGNSPSLWSLYSGASDEYPEVAGVICRALGYPAGLLLPSDTFGSSDGPFLLSIEGCSGAESSLAECHLQYTSICSFTTSVACLNTSMPATTATNGPESECVAAAAVAALAQLCDAVLAPASTSCWPSLSLPLCSPQVTSPLCSW